MLEAKNLELAGCYHQEPMSLSALLSWCRQKAAKYANSNRTLVLIDADKIEKMAEDEDYRKKYEDIIGNANSQLDQMKQSLGSMIGNVKTFGI